jgi:hypothetical protein
MIRNDQWKTVNKHLADNAFASFSVPVRNLSSILFICGLIFFLTTIIYPQKIAIVTPEKTSQSEEFVGKFSASLENKFSVIDLSLAESVLRVKNFETPFNLTNEEAKNLAVSIGCNFLILIKTDTIRRSSFERNEYYESFAIFYLISSRTGRLVFWYLKNFEENTPLEARSKLFSSIDNLRDKITDQIKISGEKELTEKIPEINELPEAGSPEAKGFRPPLPYRRIKPKYTNLAALYNLVATVDILVDIDENGRIRRTEIVRWAGFGLGESVIKTVQAMTWRPADRNGKTMPMRVLLRYNFRNIETE